MIQDAVDTADTYLDPPTAKLLRQLEAGRSRETRLFLRTFNGNLSLTQRQLICLKSLVCGNRAAFDYYLSRFSKGPKWPQGAPDTVKKWLPGAALQSVA
jgi:hypothetical protein